MEKLINLELERISGGTEYVCQNPNGCRAKIMQNGVLVGVDIEHGESVDTTAGWVIKPNDRFGNKTKKKTWKVA